MRLSQAEILNRGDDIVLIGEEVNRHNLRQVINLPISIIGSNSLSQLHVILKEPADPKITQLFKELDMGKIETDQSGCLKWTISLGDWHIWNEAIFDVINTETPLLVA